MYIIEKESVVMCHLTQHVADRKYFLFVSVFFCNILAKFFIEFINFVVCLRFFGNFRMGGTSTSISTGAELFLFLRRQDLCNPKISFLNDHFFRKAFVPSRKMTVSIFFFI